MRKLKEVNISEVKVGDKVMIWWHSYLRDGKVVKKARKRFLVEFQYHPIDPRDVGPYTRTKWVNTAFVWTEVSGK